MFKDYLTYIKITERSGDSPRGRVMGRGSLCCRLPADLSVGSACSPAWIRTLPASLARTEIGRPCFTPAHRDARGMPGFLKRGLVAHAASLALIENLEVRTPPALREVIAKPKQTEACVNC